MRIRLGRAFLSTNRVRGKRGKRPAVRLLPRGVEASSSRRITLLAWLHTTTCPCGYCIVERAMDEILGADDNQSKWFFFAWD